MTEHQSHESRFSKGQIAFVERLTLLSWLLKVWPAKASHIFYMEATTLGLFAAGFMLGKEKVEYFKFRLVDIRDDEGKMIRFTLAYNDLFEVEKDILRSSAFQAVQKEIRSFKNLWVYLRKKILVFDFQNPCVYRTLFLVHAANWKMKQLGLAQDRCNLFLNQSLWLNEINRYANKFNVKVISLGADRFCLKRKLLSLLGPSRFKCLRHLYVVLKKKGIIECFKELIKGWEGRLKFPLKFNTRPEGSAKIAVDYYGQLNLDKSYMQSDLFFLNHSPLKASDIHLTFGIPRAPLGPKENEELTKAGIASVCVNPQATTLSESKVFNHWPVKAKVVGFSSDVERILKQTPEGRWVSRETRAFNEDVLYWMDFSLKNNVRMAVSWFKYDASHCVIAQALHEISGISVIYQRAFEELATLEVATAADVVFSFAHNAVQLEEEVDSHIMTHVINGYPGDFRFPSAETYARDIRESLEKNGARFILAYFDENSLDDERFHTGHEFIRENYRFLFEKVLSQNDFGLVLKPKVSNTLRKRLGPVAGLLSKAEKTGRLYFVERGVLHDSLTPCSAALASDVAVHGHLWASTAGLEAALSGVPTLLMDREHWTISTLYKLGKGKVVFDSWDELWSAVMAFKNDALKITKLGDWSPLLDKFDPFRDGKAALRMGTFLKDMLDGLNDHLSKEEVLMRAASRYQDIWGSDKVMIHFKKD